MLNRFFFEELGFAGNVNDYHDPRNSYCHAVLRDAARHSRSRWRCSTWRSPARSACARGRLLPRPFPGPAAPAAGRGRDRPVHRPVAVARRLEALLDLHRRRPCAAATATCRWACSCRPPARATSSAACCATCRRSTSSGDDSAAAARRADRLVILLPDAWEERRDRGLVHAASARAEDRRWSTWPATSSTRPTRRTPTIRKRLAELGHAARRLPGPVDAMGRPREITLRAALRRPRGGVACSLCATGTRPPPRLAAQPAQRRREPSHSVNRP